MLAYIILPNTKSETRSIEELRSLLGFDFEYAPQVWGTMCGVYFSLSSPEEISDITKRLMPYCMLLMTYTAMRAAGNSDEAIRVRVDKLLRPRLMPAIENVAPLDF